MSAPEPLDAKNRRLSEQCGKLALELAAANDRLHSQATAHAAAVQRAVEDARRAHRRQPMSGDLREALAALLDDGDFYGDSFEAADAILALLRERGVLVEWREIESAPREPEEPYGSAPILLLASASGHRALGYWGKGRRNTDPTWISIHDHMPISYWNALEFWSRIPAAPAPTTGEG